MRRRIEGLSMPDLDGPTQPAPDVFYDCLVISDLHLGSDVCQARLLEEFLEWATRHTRELVINGDIFDDLNFKRLTRRHFACLKIIRRNSDREDFHLIWIRGNHDGPAEIVSHIVGVEILDEYAYGNGKVRLLILHGDQFDTIITQYKWLTATACKMFYGIQKWAPHNTSRWVRRLSKKWQRNSQLVQRGAIEYARSKGYRYVTCGHTHLPLVAEVDGVDYFNTGTWTDHPPCPYLAVRGAEVMLEYWPPSAPPGAPSEATPVAETTGET
jgi:UDP-2,3-diacylglucosamine pyrophosphatase LpxH